jgi:hypothetical protein
MDLQGFAFEPATPTRSKLRRLHFFREPEDALVERPRLVFPTGRHRNQNVVYAANWHSYLVLNNGFSSRRKFRRRAQERQELPFVSGHYLAGTCETVRALSLTVSQPSLALAVPATFWTRGS